MQTSKLKVLFTKLMLLGFAAILSLLLAELAVAKVIKYPSYGMVASVRYRKGEKLWGNIRKPHAKEYNVEGKNLAKFNNYGFPGIDIDSLNKPIVVLGSSFVEALQYAPEQISTSVFASELRKRGMAHNVMNLGCSGHDPYDSWFRLLYFRETLGFETQDVILVLNSDNDDWFTRHPQPLDFSKPADFGSVNSNMKYKILLAMKNFSSLIALLTEGSRSGETAGVKEVESVTSPIPPNDDRHKESLSAQTLACLDAFDGAYVNFRVLTVDDDGCFNNALQEYCANKGIPLCITPMAKPEYMINGAGHFNLKGNEYLGKQLYALFAKQDIQQLR